MTYETTKEVPQEGDLVTLDFDVVNGMDDSHKGQVLSVDTDPTGEYETLFLEISDKPNNNSVIHYYEGEDEEGEYSLAIRYSEFSGSTRIGENVVLDVVA